MSHNNRNHPAANGPDHSPGPARKTVQFGILAIAIVAVGLFMLFKPKPNDEAAPANPPPPTPADQTAGNAAPDAPVSEWKAPRPPPIGVAKTTPTTPASPTPTVPLAPTEAAPPTPPASAMAPQQMQQQLNKLAQLDLSQGDLSQQELDTLAQSVQGLFGQGQSAFVEATRQMSPQEIENLAYNLNALAPDQARPFALAAASAALDAASTAATKEDVGPLFRVLQENGGPDAASKLEGLAKNWKYYSTIALANLADDAGVPALVKMVSDPNNASRSSRNAALQALAQVAPDSPDAFTVLEDQAKANTIPFSTWINIASVLGGHDFQIGTASPDDLPPELARANMKSWHLEMTKEDFYSIVTPGNLTPEQIQQRQDIIGSLMQATQDPGVKKLLEQASSSLVNRAAPPGAQGN